MHSDHATVLLRSAHDDVALHALLAALGFPSPPLALDDTARERLGLPHSTHSARVARGDGVLRALVVDLTPRASVREALALIARPLASRTPQLLWLVIVRSTSDGTLGIATWLGGATPRLAALTTSRDHVTSSDAETLCALAAASTVTTDGVRHLRWFDALGRESVTRRFFVALRTAIAAMTDALPNVPDAAAREIALLTTCRLLFLSFIETKGWLAGDHAFLTNAFANCMTRRGGFHRTILEPLFFGTLNTPPRDRAPHARAFGAIPFLNGGLFSRTIIEKRFRHARFSDDALGTLFGDVLVRYRFTPRETTSTEWSESAIDPEILGKTFESLMATDDRRHHGVFYTPQSYVERLVSLALVPGLSSDRNDAALIERVLHGETIDAAARDRVAACASRMRVLDPACGSGAFLVHVLERLASLRATLGDDRPMAAIRRSVLETSIHGVDVSPTAVWLCQLRLWLATVIDVDVADPMRTRPLPNLDRQIRVGDSLAGDDFDATDATMIRNDSSGTRIATLRRRYVSATGRRKATLARALDSAERHRALALLERELTTVRAKRLEILAHARSADLFRARHGLDAATHLRLRELRTTCRRLQARLTTLRHGGALPFSYGAHFADVADAGGFDAVVGNPPWVRIHNIPIADRTSYRARFAVLRRPAWAAGADACAGRGFASQGDLAAPFVERGIQLLRPSGVIALLLPAKIWRSLAGGGLRRLVTEHAEIHALEDCSEARPEFDAAVYPSLFVATRALDRHEAAEPATTIAAAAHRGDSVHHWRIPSSRLAYDRTPGAPWLLVPSDVRHAFDALRDAGIPLATTHFGRPWLGVKSGCNAPFIVRASDGDPACVASGDETGLVERAMLRPVLRGEHVTAWQTPPSGEHVVWTHDVDGDALRVLPPATHDWLRRWRRQLERRSDARRLTRWWTLFRTEAADPRRVRVVWNDIGRTPRATLLLPGDPTVPLNTCYVARAPSVDDALALTTLLNAPIVAAWLAILAEPARGAYHRYLGWTLAALPVPRDWQRAVAILAPIARDARAGRVPNAVTLDAAVLEAFAIAPSSVAPLVAWNDAS